MNTMRQPQTMCDILHRDRQRLLTELIKANLQIQTKIITFKKLFLYQANCNAQTMLQGAGSNYMAQHNLQVITKKITHLMIYEETEISKLALVTWALSERIRNIDRKIQLMGMFEVREQQAMAKRKKAIELADQES
jgi:predicted proteasome-type protease